MSQLACNVQEKWWSSFLFCFLLSNKHGLHRSELKVLHYYIVISFHVLKGNLQLKRTFSHLSVSGSGFWKAKATHIRSFCNTANSTSVSCCQLILDLCNENWFFSLKFTVLHLTVVKNNLMYQVYITYTKSVILTEQSQINHFYYFLISPFKRSPAARPNFLIISVSVRSRNSSFSSWQHESVLLPSNVILQQINNAK